MLLKLDYPIVHQMQPTPCSCVATCIAMAVGIPVAKLGVDLERSQTFDLFGVWLAERGIWLRRGIRMATHGEPFYNGRVYLIGVRSLNIVDSDHAVLLDTRPPRKEGPNYNEKSGRITYDPNEGREGKKTYNWVDENLVLDFCELVCRDDRYRQVGEAPSHQAKGTPS